MGREGGCREFDRAVTSEYGISSEDRFQVDGGSRAYRFIWVIQVILDKKAVDFEYKL